MDCVSVASSTVVEQNHQGNGHVIAPDIIVDPIGLDRLAPGDLFQLHGEDDADFVNKLVSLGLSVNDKWMVTTAKEGLFQEECGVNEVVDENILASQDTYESQRTAVWLALVNGAIDSRAVLCEENCPGYTGEDRNFLKTLVISDLEAHSQQLSAAVQLLADTDSQLYEFARKYLGWDVHKLIGITTKEGIIFRYPELKKD